MRDQYREGTERLAAESGRVLSWDDVACICTSELERLAGRGSRRQGLPFLDGHAKEVEKNRTQLRYQYDAYRRVQGTDAEPRLRGEYKEAKAKARGQRRHWRKTWLLSVVEKLEHAMEVGDMGRFYSGLKELGVTLDEAASGRQVVHTPSELREHFRRIGDAESVVVPEVLSRLPPDRACADYLADLPSDEEIRRVWKKMRESAGGPDEVTINMLRYSGQTLQERFFDLVRRLWQSLGSWEPSVHAAEVLALFKKGDRAKLDNYRCICLLSVASRVVARVISCRLRDHTEAVGTFRCDQWGFRLGRSTRDAILFARLLIETASRVRDPGSLDHLCLSLLDIKKAYPSTPRNAAWRFLQNEGVPAHVINLLQHLHSDTIYRCRNSLGTSEPYHLRRGLREGCPSSCMVYLMFHNAVLRDYVSHVDASGGSTVTFGTRDTSEVGAPPAHLYARIREEWETVVARMVCFADDTTLLERETATLSRKRLVTRVLADWKESVHPGKWHHLRVRHRSEVPVVAEAVRRRVRGKRAAVAPVPPSRSLGGRGSSSQYLGVRLRHKQPHPVVMEDHVELLGSILSADGSCTADTANRLKQARRVWFKIHRQLGRLGFSQRERYRVVAATVEASLFYASETRPFNTLASEMAEYQRFLNRCLRHAEYQRFLNRCRGVCLSEQFKMRDMKGHITMQDLRKRVGQHTVSTALDLRKLGYLGHMGRYAPIGWSASSLSASSTSKVACLAPVSRAPRGALSAVRSWFSCATSFLSRFATFLGQHLRQNATSGGPPSVSGSRHVRRSTTWTCTPSGTPRRKNAKLYRCRRTLGLVFRLPPLLLPLSSPRRPMPRRQVSRRLLVPNVVLQNGLFSVWRAHSAAFRLSGVSCEPTSSSLVPPPVLRVRLLLRELFSRYASRLALRGVVEVGVGDLSLAAPRWRLPVL